MTDPNNFISGVNMIFIMLIVFGVLATYLALSGNKKGGKKK